MIEGRTPRERMHYLQGKLDAYFDFAWMKDGVSYLGTCGTKYKEFIKPIKKELEEIKEDLGEKEVK